MLVFPLIPPSLKLQLPNQPKVEFVHNHALGAFNFTVKKSPVGFNATIRPMLSETENPSPHSSHAPDLNIETTPQTFAISTSAPTPVSSFSNNTTQDNSFKKAGAQNFLPASEAAASFESLSDYSASEIKIEEPVYKIKNAPEVETVPVYDAQFSTTFSDTATYEPPLRPQEFAAADDYGAPPQIETSFENEAYNFQPNQFVETAQQQNTNQPQTFSPTVAANSNPPIFAAAIVNTQICKRIGGAFYRMADAGASALVKKGLVEPRDAYIKAVDKTNFEAQLNRSGFKT